MRGASNRNPVLRLLKLCSFRNQAEENSSEKKLLSSVLSIATIDGETGQDNARHIDPETMVVGGCTCISRFIEQKKDFLKGFRPLLTCLEQFKAIFKVRFFLRRDGAVFWL